MSHNILIVDDSATTRALLRRAVTLSEVAVAKIHEAPDGRAALDLFEANTPIDFVLADLNMPRMGGVELTTRLRERPDWRRVPVVVVSSESMEAKIAALKAAGIRGYVKKPFAPEQIRNVLNLLLAPRPADVPAAAATAAAVTERSAS